MIKKYEVMYIVDQNVQDQKAITTKLNSILTANGGKIIESEEWGLKEFAYEINKKNKGYYFVLIVETESANILEFQRIAKIEISIVRELVINTENEKKYIQSTKLSKTDMSKFKEEKPARTFEKRPIKKYGDTKEVSSTPATPANVEETEKKPTKRTTTKKDDTKDN